MLRVRFDRFDPPVRQVLCLGAHCDDLEIGCGGTVLTLAGSPTPPAFTSRTVTPAEASQL